MARTLQTTVLYCLSSYNNRLSASPLDPRPQSLISQNLFTNCLHELKTPNCRITRYILSKHYKQHQSHLHLLPPPPGTLIPWVFLLMLAENRDLVNCILWHLSRKLSLNLPRHIVSRSFSSGWRSSTGVPASHSLLLLLYPVLGFSGVVDCCCWLQFASAFLEFELIWPIVGHDQDQARDQDLKRIKPMSSLLTAASDSFCSSPAPARDQGWKSFFFLFCTQLRCQSHSQGWVMLIGIERLNPNP